MLIKNTECSLNIFSGYGVGITASAKFATSQNNDFKQVQKLFTQFQGEVQFSKAECFTQDVEIDSSIRPKFTQGFINNLVQIQRAIDSNANVDDQVVAFIRKFGTHYSAKTDFGAKMVYEEMFSSTSSTSEEVWTQSNFEMSCQL